MDEQELRALLDELRALPKETEWAEFKLNYSDPSARILVCLHTGW